MCAQAHPRRVGRKDQAGCGQCPSNLHGNAGSQQLGQPKQPWGEPWGLHGLQQVAAPARSLLSWQRAIPLFCGTEGRTGRCWEGWGDRELQVQLCVDVFLHSTQESLPQYISFSLHFSLWRRPIWMHLLNKSLFLPRLLSALTVLNMKSLSWNTGTSGLQQKKKSIQIIEFRKFRDQRWGYRTDWLGWRNNKTYDPAFLISLATGVPKSELGIYKCHETTHTKKIIQKYFNVVWLETPFSEI